MAGTGRNLPTIAPYCRHLEALEMVSRHTCRYPKKIGQTQLSKHSMKLQDFVWPASSYDLVVGIWCLSYLNTTDAQKLLTDIARSLTTKGSLIVNEAILKEGERKFRYQEEEQQQMVVRSESWYLKLFKLANFKILHSSSHEPDDFCTDHLRMWVVRPMRSENS